MRPSDRVLFLDESYSPPQQDRQSFYIIAGASLKKRVLNDTRDDICDIVGDSWWHTTEALQNETTGIPRLEELLSYCSRHQDPIFVAQKAPLPSESDIEQARQICLAGLLKHTNSQISAVVLESRQYKTQDDADRSLIKRLRRAGDVAQSTPAVHVSPKDEQLLWLPDLAAMMYRRQITHTNTTGKYFATYLAESTTVIDLGSYTLMKETRPGESLVTKLTNGTVRPQQGECELIKQTATVEDACPPQESMDLEE